MARIGINGFGRKGKMLLRAIIERYPDKIIPVGINNSGAESIEYLAYLFKYDSTHGRFYGEVCHDDKHIIINKLKIPVFKEADIKKIPWTKDSAEYVVECSEQYLTTDKAKLLIQGSVKKVVMSYSLSNVPVYIFGVNECKYDPKEKVLSMASPTTNCLAPLVKIVHEKFGIREGLMTAIHSVSSDQKVLDGSSKKSWRYGRAALINVFPVVTEAANTVGKVIPELKGKLTGMEFRVPIAAVSVIDLTLRICRSAKIGEINEEVKNASQSSLSGILCYTEEQLVSTDFIGSACSLMYDATASIQLNDNFIKLISWYDDDYGYACRLADLVSFIHAKDQYEAQKQTEQTCKDNEKNGNNKSPEIKKK